MTIELALLAAALLLSLFFSLGRAALIASSRDELRRRAAAGGKGAISALGLLDQTSLLLAISRSGQGLCAVCQGALWMTPELVSFLSGLGAPAARVVLVLCGGLFYLALGEFLPRRLARSAPEFWASVCARPLSALVSLSAGPAALLERVGGKFLSWFGVSSEVSSKMTEEDLRDFLDVSLARGAINPMERRMVEGILELNDETVAEIATPRTRLVFADANRAEQDWTEMAASGHSHFPVHNGDRDNIIGIVSVKRLWAALAQHGEVRVRDVMTRPLFVPGTMKTDRLLREFRTQKTHVALVLDEFGGLEGLVTLVDLFEDIMGRLPEKGQPDEPKLRARGSAWVVDGAYEIRRLNEVLGEKLTLEEGDVADFTTLAGLILHVHEGVPTEGDRIEWQGWTFEILDMDRQRIDKVLVERA